MHADYAIVTYAYIVDTFKYTCVKQIKHTLCMHIIIMYAHADILHCHIYSIDIMYGCIITMVTQSLSKNYGQLTQ